MVAQAFNPSRRLRQGERKLKSTLRSLDLILNYSYMYECMNVAEYEGPGFNI